MRCYDEDNTEEEGFWNSDSYAHELQRCAKTRDLTGGKMIHAHIILSNFEFDMFVHNHLLNMYAKCGNLENASQVFVKMPQRNVVSWTAIMAGYDQHGYGEDVLNYFSEMHRAGDKPNGFTFVSVLSACASLASPERGKQDMLSTGELRKLLNFCVKWKSKTSRQTISPLPPF